MQKIRIQFLFEGFPQNEIIGLNDIVLHNSAFPFLIRFGKVQKLEKILRKVNKHIHTYTREMLNRFVYIFGYTAFLIQFFSSSNFLSKINSL